MISEEQNPQTHEIQPPAEAPKQRFLESPQGERFAAWTIGSLTVVTFILGFFYLRFAHNIDRRLDAGPFSSSINIFTAPRTVAVGDELSIEGLTARLRSSGYTTSRGNPIGWYNVTGTRVEIFPGRDSYEGGEPGMLEFAGNKVERIVSLQDNTARQEMELEPQLIANLSGQREKRRLVRFSDIPQPLVHAVISAEDKHFFQHSGFDMLRVFKAAYVDLKDGRKEQGASTLTMQLARGLWLEPEKRWKRKVQELLITLHLEERLSKQKIFEDYANQVYLGRHGTFSINGFGEAARVYFGKDLSQLNNAESALLAGMVQRPSYFNPYRNPDRARERRNLVLTMMHSNGYLTSQQFEDAQAAPVKVIAEPPESMQAQYFVDLMNDEVQSKLDDHDKQMRYIYTTLDPELQQAAEEAVNSGMKSVDQLLRTGKKKGVAAEPDQPQVALIALDPHTGEIKALVGGRNYANSQLNHALAMRQPGSVFKSFVYAAALETAVSGGPHIFTPASVVDDSPTTFYFGRKSYQPANFHHEFMGSVTLRTALAHSLNVATVQVAQAIGFDRVVAMAQRAGLNEAIKPTPAVALGAYETTPLEIAGAYTMFANHGARITPTTIALVRAPDSSVVYQHQPDERQTLDPRVTYLMVNMMQEVLRSGTGASVRSRGFTQPAAGKTGTSHDGWFAGFTSNLLCVVWVGFDDNRELNLEGAKSALPIWADFMKHAAQFRKYRDAQQFQPPPGIVNVRICADSGELAGDLCPNVRSDVFIDGTQPAIPCQLHAPQPTEYADRVVDSSTMNAVTVPPAATLPRTVPASQPPPVQPPPSRAPINPPATAPTTVPATNTLPVNRVPLPGNQLPANPPPVAPPSTTGPRTVPVVPPRPGRQQ